MQCEFCDARLPEVEPPNLALLAHVAKTPECRERFGFLLENLNASWTPAMSGG